MPKRLTVADSAGWGNLSLDESFVSESLTSKVSPDVRASFPGQGCCAYQRSCHTLSFPLRIRVHTRLPVRYLVGETASKNGQVLRYPDY